MLTTDRLRELRSAALPHAVPTPMEDGALEAEVAAYLKDFLPGRDDCVCCGARTGGICGSFRWGLQNGEGECSTCWWPMRVVHLVGAVAFTSVLQYHPNALEARR